jgi:hypothetical protein
LGRLQRAGQWHSNHVARGTQYCVALCSPPGGPTVGLLARWLVDRGPASMGGCLDAAPHSGARHQWCGHYPTGEHHGDGGSTNSASRKWIAGRLHCGALRRCRRRGTPPAAAAQLEDRRLGERSGGLSGSGDDRAGSLDEWSSTGGEHDEASPATGVDGGGLASCGSECDGNGFARLDDAR